MGQMGTGNGVGHLSNGGHEPDKTLKYVDGLRMSEFVVVVTNIKKIPDSCTDCYHFQIRKSLILAIVPNVPECSCCQEHSI